MPPPMEKEPNVSLRSPFGRLASDLSDRELRETAYEILVGACRSTGGRPLTFVSSRASPDRSLTSAAASRVKKVLGLRNRTQDAERPPSKDSAAVAELMRLQMGVSEQADARVRRGLLRIAAGQLGRRIEFMVLPIEFLQQFKASDFTDQQEYEAWQERHLKILEAGLLLHPYLPLEKSDDSAQKARELIHKGLQCHLETGKGSEPLQSLRNSVMSLACRSFDGSTLESYHWADGSPLNFYLYQMLLEACFDRREGSMLEEVDEMLETIRKTWAVLGMNQRLHNLCFMWILFRQFALTGYKDDSLLVAADNQMIEVAKDVKGTRDPVYTKILNSLLRLISGWVERQLLAYHEVFHPKNLDLMECVLSLAVSSAKILEETISEYFEKKENASGTCERIDSYIRSSLRSAFSQRMEKASSERSNGKPHDVQRPIVSIIAKDIGDLVRKEKEIFSPVLKKWHPLAMGVAVATLHRCYGEVLKQFVADVTELTVDSANTLMTADKLEKDLVDIAVDVSVNSEDGGKAIIQEMPPYEAISVLSNLGMKWIKDRMLSLTEWVNRNIQEELWEPYANKANVAPSSIEILRMVDGTLESFFELSIPLAALVPDLVIGLDENIQHYISAVMSGCGNRGMYIPTLPMLTRCSGSSKIYGVWKKKDKFTSVQKRRLHAETDSGEQSLTVPELCLRLNTIYHIRLTLENLEKRIVTTMKNSSISQPVEGLDSKFTSSISICQEGIRHLCEALAYRTVFCDLNHVLWEGLYVGDVASSRIRFLLQELDSKLEMISKSLHDKVRNRAITATMKACFEGFLLVLLAGGPPRAFSCVDFQVLEEDFQCLIDLFLADGDGIPQEVVEKAAVPIRNVLPLFHEDSESLINQLKHMVAGASSPTTKAKLPLPPTTGHWSPTDPETILRILCYRNDEVASKFLKKAYNLPKRF